MKTKPQKGSAMVMAVLIGLVFTVIGTVMLKTNDFYINQVQNSEDLTLANSYAASGVELALGLIKKGGFSGSFEEYRGRFGGPFVKYNTGDEDIDDYEMRFTIELIDNEYIINSYGYARKGEQQGQGVEARSDFLKYTYPTTGSSDESGGEGQVPRLDMIFAAGINPDGKAFELIGSSEIHGDTGTNSTEPNSVSFSWETYIKQGDLYIGPGGDYHSVVWSPRPDEKDHISNGSIKTLNAARNYTLPEFPSFPDLAPKGSITAGYWPIPPGGHRISENGQYSSISVSNQLTIDIGNEDIIIRTNKLSLTGNGQIILNRTGSGKLIIYVADTFELTGSSTINIDGDYNSLIMYYDGINALDIPGDTYLVGSVFANNADINIRGSGGITGHIITGGSLIKIKGNAEANVRAIYAPNAALNISGSSVIKGAVAARDIKVFGNSEIYLDQTMSMDFFNQLDWGTASDGSGGKWSKG